MDTIITRPTLPLSRTSGGGMTKTVNPNVLGILVCYCACLTPIGVLFLLGFSDPLPDYILHTEQDSGRKLYPR